jgi:TonB family protein
MHPVGETEAAVKAELEAPVMQMQGDPLQGLRLVLVDAATSQPSKRTHLRVPDILLNPYARRRLIVRSLSAVAVIASVVIGLVFLRSHRELIGAGFWSWSIRSAVLEVEEFIHGNDATSDGKPSQTPPAVVIFRHHGNSAAQLSGRSPQLAEGIKPTEAIQPDELINPAAGQPRFNSEAQVSKQLPAITILGSRQVPGRPHVATPAADPTDPVPAPAPGRFFVSQQISGSLPERPALLTYPVWARQENPEGSVVARATISQDGRVRTVRLVSGDPLLATAILEAVSQWRYKPWIYGPAETETQITVTFIISTK